MQLEVQGPSQCGCQKIDCPMIPSVVAAREAGLFDDMRRFNRAPRYPVVFRDCKKHGPDQRARQRKDGYVECLACRMVYRNRYRGKLAVQEANG